MTRAAAVAVALLLLLAGCGSPVTRALEPTPERASLQPQTPATQVDPRVAMTWPEPDDALTPGLVVASCTYPRDEDERDVTASTKRAAAARYRYTGPSGLRYVEYDHRVPFSLCGANTVANIWPQPADGVRQTAYVANRKDQLEAYAARQVRYGRWSLRQGQAVFLGDWRSAWCEYLHYEGVVCP